MKQFLFLFSLILLLYSCQQESKTHKKEQKIVDSKDFAIKDINKITKIIMREKEGTSITLEKNKNEEWIINQKYKGWKEIIDYRLNTMKDIKIQSSVPEEREKEVIKQLSTSFVKIEIYTTNANLAYKSYYIGGNTSNQEGTYMLMEGSSTPYIMHIPGKIGLIAPKYGIGAGNKIDLISFREWITISIKPTTIEKIEVIDFKNSDQSFYIDMINQHLLTKDKKVIDIHQDHLKNFCNEFTEIKCGAYSQSLKKSDLILSKKIFIKHDNISDTLTIYQKEEIKDIQKKTDPNVEINYGTWNNSEIFKIQPNQEFNKVLITLDEFIK